MLATLGMRIWFDWKHACFKMADVLDVDVDKPEFFDDEGEGRLKSQLSL